MRDIENGMLLGHWNDRNFREPAICRCECCNEDFYNYELDDGLCRKCNQEITDSIDYEEDFGDEENEAIFEE